VDDTPEQRASRWGKGEQPCLPNPPRVPVAGVPARVGGEQCFAGSRRETTAALNIGVGSSTARVHGNEGLALGLGGVVSCTRRLSVAAGALVWPRATCKLRSVERDVLCCAKP
jgi:hypothetical protein